MELRGYLYVLCAACLWGLIGPVSKLAFAEGVTPLETSFWRAVFSWGLFAAHAGFLKEVRVQRRDLFPVLAFGAVGVAAFYLVYQLAVRDVGAAMASVLLYTAPAWVAAMAAVLLKEPMGRMKLVALALTLAGVACVSLGPKLLSGGGVSLSAAGILLGLASGFCYALYYIFGKLFLNRYATPTIFLYANPVGALILAPFTDFSSHTPFAWFCLLVLAVCSTYGAYSIYYAGLKRLEATRAAVTATLEPVLAAVLAFLWFGEVFDALGYVGSVLILAAVLLTILDGGRRRD